MVVHMVKSILLRIQTNGARCPPELGGSQISLTEKPEGVAVQCVPFEGTRYQCAREPLPHMSRRCSPIRIKRK